MFNCYNAGAKENVEKELQKLTNTVDAQQKQIAGVASDTVNFSKAEDQNIRNFLSDVQKAQAEIGGDKKALKALMVSIELSLETKH